MSNNADVAYDGTSFYFTAGSSHKVREIEANPSVLLSFTGRRDVISGMNVYVLVEGVAELIRDQAQFKQHWASDLDAWFENGIATPGLVLIKVTAHRIKFWDGMDQGELILN